MMALAFCMDTGMEDTNDGDANRSASTSGEEESLRRINLLTGANFVT